jgi:phage terminase small subunit
MEKKSRLTDKQEMFCRQYVIDWNATRAAIAAGYSENTAQVIGSENLSKPIIKEYIEEIQKDLAKLAGISALSNIKHLTDILEAEGDDKEATKDRIAALKVVNDMMGWNAPVKKDITLDDKTMSKEEREARIAALQSRAKDDK